MQKHYIIGGGVALIALAGILFIASRTGFPLTLEEKSGPSLLGAEVLFARPANGNRMAVYLDGNTTMVYQVRNSKYTLADRKHDAGFPAPVVSFSFFLFLHPPLSNMSG